MADETKNPAGGFNPQELNPKNPAVASVTQTQADEATLPEPTILEEHIVRHAPTAPSLLAQEIPQEAPIEKKIPPPVPQFVPKPEIIPPAPVIVKLIEPVGTPPVQPGAPLQVKPLAPPRPAVSVPEKVPAQPAPATFEPPHEPIRDDIARILGGIKLPDRPEFKARGDTRPAPIELKPILEDSPPAAAPAAKPPSENRPKDPEKPTSIVTPVRTLKDDLQEVVREKKISVVRATALEMDKHRGQAHLMPQESDVQKQRSGRTKGILFSAAILFVLGFAALFGVFFIASQQSAPPPPQSQSSILFAEQAVAFPLGNQSPNDVKNLLARARTSQSGALGSITQIVPTVDATDTSGNATQRAATLSEFLAALGANPPADLTRSLSSDFFFGFHTVDTNAPLFVIPVLSYDHAFADMLEWEPTMNADLAPVFTSVPAVTTDENGLPTARTFVDGVLRNYDVRELKDDSGNIVMYYSFPTPNILVIAQSTYSFTEILSRLQAERKL